MKEEHVVMKEEQVVIKQQYTVIKQNQTIIMQEFAVIRQVRIGPTGMKEEHAVKKHVLNSHTIFRKSISLREIFGIFSISACSW